MTSDKQVEIPTGLSAAVSTFLAECDEVRLTDETPLAGSGIIKGKLVLILGETFTKLSDRAKIAVLEHEVSHFVLAHGERIMDRNPLLWNIVTDSAINHIGCADWELVEKEIQTIDKKYKGFKSATFERLDEALKLMGQPGIMPMPPEAAYQIVLQQIPPPEKGGGEGDSGGEDSDGPLGNSCGRFTLSQKDMSEAELTDAIVKRVLVSMKVSQADPEFMKRIRGGGAGQGSGGYREIEELPPPKPWIRSVLQYLTKTMKRHNRARSWRREHRVFPDTLPGQSSKVAYGARILLDASGSITPDLVAEFLSAISKTPELASSDVVVFDTSWSNPIPVSEVAQIKSAITKRGGGTSIRGVGQAMREPGRAVVWLTDACSGDGWPDPHTDVEVWCVWGSSKPPAGHGHVIRIDSS